MTALSLNKQVNQKIDEISKKQNVTSQHVVGGKLMQAKGIVLEQLGNISNDERMRLAGKKDQLTGKLQANYGDKWLVRNRGWLMMLAAVAAFIFLRNSNS